MQAPAGTNQASTPALQAAVRAGNVNIGVGSGVEIMDLSATSLEEQEKHAILLKRVEAERRARAIVVPTNKDEVAQHLRRMGQPIRYFGEHVADIRERLRNLLAQIELEGEEVTAAGLGAPPPPPTDAAGQSSAVEEVKKDVYSEASEELIQARKSIYHLSVRRAAERLSEVKRRRTDESEQKSRDEEAMKLYDSIGRLNVQASQLGDVRPLTCVKCSPGGGLVATGALSNVVKIWDMDSGLSAMGVLGGPEGHTERNTGLAWHPTALLTDEAPLLATSAADKTAKIWRLRKPSEDETMTDGGSSTSGGECVMTMRGHEQRLGMVGFHPGGEYIGTASYDRTWRLWHVETGKEMLLQDGHIKEVHMITFQKDGALVCSGDFAGIGNVWDLRCGKKIMSLVGHVKRIVSGDFSPNGFQVATGGDDHSVRIWDLRVNKCSYMLPAHGNVVSSARFNHNGEAFLTSSFDGKVRVWSSRDWKLLVSLTGHEGKVMGADWTALGSRGVVSVGFDRTLKRWADDEY